MARFFLRLRDGRGSFPYVWVPHNLVEPARDGPPGGRWEVVLAADGIPEVWPPVRVDPERHPLRHQRFRIPETLE